MYAAYQSGLDRAHERLRKVNVLVAGSAGVVKSVARKIDLYTFPGEPIAIHDTRGFEIRNAADTVEAVNDEIAELRCATDPDAQIHVAWLCILEQSHRIEPVHGSFLAMLATHRVPASRSRPQLVDLLGTFSLDRVNRKVRLPPGAPCFRSGCGTGAAAQVDAAPPARHGREHPPQAAGRGDRRRAGCGGTRGAPVHR